MHVNASGAEQGASRPELRALALAALVLAHLAVVDLARSLVKILAAAGSSAETDIAQRGAPEEG
jgi:hypothetical protein